MKKKLSYRNESHKAYGAAGMAISLVVFDGENMLASVNLDRDGYEMVQMSPDFYFSGNPSLSAKAAWSRLVGNFNLTAVMTIGNALCRSLVLENKELDADLLSALRDAIVEEALDTCQLEQDEASRIFDKDFNYLHRVFSNTGVHEVAHDFVDELTKRRELSRHDVIEVLHAIAML